MKIALIGAFNLADGYLGATKAIKRLGYEVVFIPAYLYNNEVGKQKHHMAIIDHLLKEKSDVYLWWRAETLDAMQFAKIRKNIPGKFIMYSWDDPLQWERHPEMSLKCKCLDAVFSCCMDSVEMYRQNGVPIVEWCPPGFDPESHYPEEDNDYKCDISIVCTNLYHGNQITTYPHVSRKELLDKIIRNFPSVDLRIYGPESFKAIYPDHYKGWVKFEDSHKVFYNSKINLCTHIRPDGDMYINERVSQIMGSGGLLMVDDVKNIDKVLTKENFPTTYVSFQDNQDCIEKIKNILENDSSNISLSGKEFALNNLSWDNWANKIHNKIGDL